MTCREFAEFLDAFLAGALLVEEQNAFHRHLAVCKDCVAYMDSYRRTIEACGQLGADTGPVPADVPEELVRAILASRRKQA